MMPMMHRSRFHSFVLSLGIMIGLSACTYPDPFTRPGTWHETHAAMRNLAAEVAYPQELQQGRGDLAYSGPIAQFAVSKALQSKTSGQTGSGIGTSAGASMTGSENSVSGGSAGMGLTASSSSPSAMNLAQ